MDKIEDMKKKFSEFLKERDWEKFHNPKDLAIALSIEANELLEIFEWKTTEESWQILKEKKDEIELEIADLMHFLIAFSNATGIDLYESFNKKLEINNVRYPKELVKGKTHKYSFYRKNLSEEI
ncbi:MAG: nucleotide pyrophosphohydrolase [Candidatus Woesearchaeota archaeon]